MSTSSTQRPSHNALSLLLRSISTIGMTLSSTVEHVLTQPLSSLGQLSQHEQTQVKKVLLTLHFLFPHELLPALDLLDRKLVTRLQWSILAPAPTKHDELDDQSRSMSVQNSDSRLRATRESLTKHDSSAGARALDDNSVEWTSSSDADIVEVYYIQSSSSIKKFTSSNSGSGPPTGTGVGGRYRNAYNTTETYYEVDLNSWNCSCPAFAFSSMKLLMLEPGKPDGHAIAIDSEHEKRSIAVDKHEADFESDRSKRDWDVGGLATKPGAIIPVCKHILAATLSKASPHLFGHSVHTNIVTQDIAAGSAAG